MPFVQRYYATLEILKNHQEEFGRGKVLLGIIAVDSVFEEFPESLRSQREYNHR